MAVVREDIIDGNNANLGFNGWEFQRTFIVSELVGPGYAMALEAYSENVPKMNDIHPSISDAYVVDVAPESIEEVGNAMRLVYTYRQFTPNVRVSISSRRVSVDRNTYLPDQATDVRAEMVLGYQYPTKGNLNYTDIYEPVQDKATGEGAIDEQGVTLAVAETKTDFTYSRTEWLTNLADAANGYAVGQQLTGNILKDRARLFNDKLSQSDWLISLGEPWLWQCEISAESSGNGFDWRVRYKFTYDEFGHAYRATFIDGITNQPVSDGSIAPNPDHKPSIKEFDQYQTIDFNLLGIT